METQCEATLHYVLIFHLCLGTLSLYLMAKEMGRQGGMFGEHWHAFVVPYTEDMVSVDWVGIRWDW